MRMELPNWILRFNLTPREDRFLGNNDASGSDLSFPSNIMAAFTPSSGFRMMICPKRSSQILIDRRGALHDL